MTAHETEQVALVGERRRIPGVALISYRRMVLAERLQDATVPHRHIATPSTSAAELLYGVRPPLLLDTHGMPSE